MRYLHSLDGFLADGPTLFQNRRGFALRRYIVSSVVLVSLYNAFPEGDSSLRDFDQRSLIKITHPHYDCWVFRGKSFIVIFWTCVYTWSLVIWFTSRFHWWGSRDAAGTEKGADVFIRIVFKRCRTLKGVEERGWVHKSIDIAFNLRSFLTFSSRFHQFRSEK